MNFKAGQKWLTRNGQIVTLIEIGGYEEEYSIEAVAVDQNANKLYYTRTGHFTNSHAPHALDLVRLVHGYEDKDQIIARLEARIKQLENSNIVVGNVVQETTDDGLTIWNCLVVETGHNISTVDLHDGQTVTDFDSLQELREHSTITFLANSVEEYYR